MASITQELFDRVLELRKSGMAFDKIADEVKLGRTTVRGIVSGKRQVTCDFLGRPLPHVYANSKKNGLKKNG